MNFFRNLTLFRFPLVMVDELRASIELEEKLSAEVLGDPGPGQMACAGFVPPFSHSGSLQLCESLGSGDATLMTIGLNERLLPVGVVNKAVAERIAEYKEQSGRNPNGKERKRMREEAAAELMPRAFVRTRRVRGYVDLQTGWVVVDTSSRSLAELWVSLVREALGSFPAVPVHSESTRTLLKAMMYGEVSEPDFALGEDANLADLGDVAGRITLRGQDLSSAEARAHLETGATVTALSLRFDGRCTFLLRDDLSLRSFRFTDTVADINWSDYDDERAYEHAMYTLQVLEARRLLSRLSEVFSIPAAEV